MPVPTPRLYRKPRSGIYFVRVIASVEVNGVLTRRELRRSLHTSSAQTARELGAALNAALASVPMSARTRALDDLLNALHAKTSATDLQRGLAAVTAVAPPFSREKSLVPPRNSADVIATPTSEAGHPAHTANVSDAPQRSRIDNHSAQSLPMNRGPGPLEVRNPLPWQKAVQRYAASLRADAAVKEKTLHERLKTLTQLFDFMVQQPGFNQVFHVHDVQKHHVGQFLDDWTQRPARSARTGRQDRANPAGTTVAPKSILKCISNLILFFGWANQEAQATLADPTDGLHRRTMTLRSRLNQDETGYVPFNDDHLRTIFEPTRYLRECRDADHFWAPLLGAHLGVRLGEIVTLELDSVRKHEISGIWYLDIRPDVAKNRNSVRRLPITRPLIELGLLDYVHALRRLGARSLFPHRNLDNVSARRQPSKNTSEKFARFLDVCGVRHPQLVFHSFRHNVVTALQNAGTPLHVTQQIVGHMAQDHAIRTGQITQTQARSVTFRTYTHADIPSMRAPDPFLALKTALEHAVHLPLDYRRLAQAAQVVLDHVKRVPTGFESGWPAQNRAYTERMLQALGNA